jgi:beta-glucanase (GH16 family)
MSQSAVRMCKRTTRWRPGSVLALGAIAPVIALTVAAAPSAAALAVHAVPAAQAKATVPIGVPPPRSGWSTVFSDDFNGAAGSGLDSRWMYDTGRGSSFGTGEIETMTSSKRNVHINGAGDLDIEALGSGSSWTSGRIQTTTARVGAPAGGQLKVTASIQQPAAGPGYWPAFWLLGPGQWPENGEIDIVEDVNSLSEVSGTVHCGTYPGGPCDEPTGVGSGLVSCCGRRPSFHTYTVILNRTHTSSETMTFYVDGRLYYTLLEARVGKATWHAAFDHEFSIILDLAMGGSYPNVVCNCTTPASWTTSGGTMKVNYVAAYATSA